VYLSQSKKRSCAVKQVERSLYQSHCKREEFMLRQVNDNCIPFVVKFFGSTVAFNQMCIITSEYFKLLPARSFKDLNQEKVS